MRGLPLTYHQSRLWYEAQHAPGSTAYYIPFHYLLTGPLTITSLERSLQDIVTQQEALRTYFDKTQPKQYILPEAQVYLAYLDWRHETVEDKYTFLEKSIALFNQGPFDISHYPLSQYRLIQLEDESFVFSLLWHHLIMDGRSVSLFMEQLQQNYARYTSLRGCAAHMSNDGERAISYSMHKQLQHEAETVTPIERELRRSYWSKRLSGLKNPDPFPRLAACQQDPESASPTQLYPECHRLYHKTTKAFTQALQQFIHDTHTTLFVVIAAALNVILYRYNKQTEQLISYSVNTRSSAAHDYYGFFVNNIPLRTHFSQEDSFYDLVQQIMLQRKQDKIYQDTPLIDILNVVREANENWQGTFDHITINQVTSRSYQLQLDGVQSQLIPLEKATARLPFTLLYDCLEVVEFEFEYDVTRYNKAFVEEFAAEYYAFLDNVLKTPHQSLAVITPLKRKFDHDIVNNSVSIENKIDLATPRNHIEYRVLKRFEEVLQRKGIGIQDKFFYLGGNSLMVIDLIAKLQDEFQIEISLPDVLQHPTVEGIAARLMQHDLQRKPHSPLFRLNEREAEQRLICIHPAGGTAFCYLPLVHACQLPLSAYGIQSPGIEDSHYQVQSLTAVAAEYTRLLQANRLTQSITLLGWSLGGLIAIEMAHQFAKMGIRVNRVVLLDTTAPTPKRLAQVKETSLEEFYNKLVRFNGVYPHIQDDQIHRYYSLYNALTQALKQYNLAPYAGEVLYIRSQSSETTVEEWKSFLTGPLTVIEHDADHWNFMSASSVAMIAQQLDHVLGREQYVNSV